MKKGLKRTAYGVGVWLPVGWKNCPDEEGIETLTIAAPGLPAVLPLEELP